MMLSRSAAKERFDTGHPVQLRSSRSGYAPYGWNSAALRHFGLKTFEEFDAAAHERLVDGGGTWHGAPASRQTHDIAAGHIFRREPFRIGNLSGGYHFSPVVERGDLPEKYHEDFRRADYAVFSYETPIAWVSTSAIVCVPPVRYSITTTQHQHLAARALGLDGFLSSESAREGKGRTPYTHREGY